MLLSAGVVASYISTVAGNGIGGFYGDGAAATAAELKYPYGVAVDTIGNIYIADTYNNRIRMVSKAGIITPVEVMVFQDILVMVLLPQQLN